MKWYRIENKGPDKAEIWIYEQIGEDFWTGEGITAKNFQKEISAITAKNIDLHINSPGGAVFDGVAIYNLLRQHEANITTYIDGLAASIASVIALAGDKVIMAENALYMMHNPQGLTMGDYREHAKTMDVLSKIRGTMAGVYSRKSGKSEEEINALLDEETWMSADKALEAGFVDEIGVEMDLAACAAFVPAMSKAGFKRIPKEISAKKELNERDLEKALRDAGCSRGRAKEILAKGWDGLNVREAQTDTPEPHQREAEPVKVVDEVAFLLTQAELIAPSRP